MSIPSVPALDPTVLAALIAGAFAMLVAIMTTWQAGRASRRDLTDAIAATELLKQLDGHPLASAVEKRRDELLRRWSKAWRANPRLAILRFGAYSTLALLLAWLVIMRLPSNTLPAWVSEVLGWTLVATWLLTGIVFSAMLFPTMLQLAQYLVNKVLSRVERRRARTARRNEPPPNGGT